MCGIAGYVSSKVDDGKLILERMNRTIEHRGPDDSGIYVNGVYGFGMRRLSIIDLNTGHQPIWNENNTIGVVLNGEIYNFRELREQLLKKGHHFSSASDTEVIVHLYEEEGIRCLDYLNGMFAFAIIDRNQNQLFLARDRLGEKPLYYYHANGEFVFASEIKAILAFPGIRPDLNLEALNMYLTYECVPAPHTIYQNIYKLNPGHYLTLKPGQTLEVNSYWQPSFKSISKKLSTEECIAQLRHHIERSVAMRTVSDVPLGSFLSGGIDSSLVTAFLTRTSSRRVKTFSIAFDDPSFDESNYAQDVAHYLGTDHYEERLNSRTMLEILPEIIRILDEPFADASMIPTYLLSRHTRKQVTVALSGDGGDELFAGYPTYQAHQVAGWVPRWLGKPLRALADFLPASDDNISFDFKMKRFAAGIPYEIPVRNQVWLGSFEPGQKNSLYNEEVRNILKNSDEFKMIRQYWDSCDSSETLSRIAHNDMRFYLQDDILFKVDRMSMANSLEVRAPYLDHELVEFVCALKPDLKLRGFTTKYILKKAAEGILPHHIIHRKKKGFGIPIAKWIKSDLKDLFLDVLSERNIRDGGLFNPKYVHQLLKEHLAGIKDHRKVLWTLFVFEVWRKRVPARELAMAN